VTILTRGFARAIGAIAAATVVAGLFVSTAAHATNVERVVSPGGIEAWLVRDATVPLVAVEYAFAGGASQDPAAKPGVANMVAALLDEGAGDLDASAFQGRMEELAIELRFWADRDHLRGSLRTLSARRDEAFDLLRLALNAPRFEPEAIERIRTQLAADLRRQSTDPNEIVSKTWWSTAFPGHAYGRPEKGTLESVAQINRDELRDYATRVFARDRLKIAVVGDIDAATTGRLIDRVFGSLPAKANLVEVPTVKPQGLGRRVVVDLDVPQAVVSFGGLGLPRKHPDFIAAFVVNHILGGGSFTSRLYQEVREKRGLAYGVYTSLYPMAHTAQFMGWTATRAEKTGEAIEIIEAETRRMAETGPTDDELAKAKAFLQGSYALRFDTSTKIAGQLVQIQIDDLGIDYIDKRNAQVEAVTAADAKRVAKSLLSGDYLTAIVGKPKGVTTTAGPRG
jgi:zinc protease